MTTPALGRFVGVQTQATMHAVDNSTYTPPENCIRQQTRCRVTGDCQRSSSADTVHATFALWLDRLNFEIPSQRAIFEARLQRASDRRVPSSPGLAQRQGGASSD
jgi:hypothetical protein